MKPKTTSEAVLLWEKDQPITAPHLGAHHADQNVMYSAVIAYIGDALDNFNGKTNPDEHAEYLKLWEATSLPVVCAPLNPAERAAAQSFAWKALVDGWDRSVSQFPEAVQVEVRRPVEPPAATQQMHGSESYGEMQKRVEGELGQSKTAPVKRLQVGDQIEFEGPEPGRIRVGVFGSLSVDNDLATLGIHTVREVAQQNEIAAT